MADLEKLLLEAAGRTSGGRNQQSVPPSRRQLHGSYFDEGSDSKDDEDSEDEPKYGGRKTSSTQVPLKKRAELSDRENDSTSIDDGDAKGGGGNSGDDSDVGSDLFKNEHDREALFKMCELEREMILSERASKKADKKLQQRVRTKHSSGKKTHTRKEMMSTPLISSYAVRSSVRSADRAEAMDDALNELRAKRAKQQESGTRGLSPEKQKEFRCSSGSSSSEMASESVSESEEEGLAEDDGSGQSDTEERGETEGGLEVVTFDEVKAITIRRSRLAEWFMEPFFEKLIVGCFVRVGVGKSKDKALYKICMVRGVDTLGGDKSYKLESWTTSKYLNCVYGKDKSELWQMAMVSDKEPLEEEFDKWLNAAEGGGRPIPSKMETAEKAEAIQKTRNTMICSPEPTKKAAKMNSSAWVRPLNVAAEKERLRREMGVAESREDAAEVERIRVRLREVEASRKGEQKDSKALRLAEMNRRNRAENYKTASGLKPGLKSGEEGYDPFSRRWTRSMNYYMSKTEEEAAVEEVQTAAVVESKGEEATAAALEAAADAGKLVDTSAPVDQGTESNTLHDFPLPISLAALQRLGGPQGGPAGFMARKQRQEAVIGCKLPPTDRTTHPLTLTVSDYKRRRGLL